MESDETGATPPQIVARSEKPPAALSAFIAQELEHWGFDVQGHNGTSHLIVTADDVDIRIEFSGFGRWRAEEKMGPVERNADG